MSLPFVRSYMVSLETCDWKFVDRLYAEMKEESLSALSSVGDTHQITYKFAADMRFKGQYHEIRVELPLKEITRENAPRIEESFRNRYQDVYGRTPSSLGIEVLNWHLVAETHGSGFTLTEEPGQECELQHALKGTRKVWFRADAEPGRMCAVYDRYRLEPGAVFSGPCIVEEQEATIVIPCNCQVTVDGFRNILVTLQASEQAK